MSGYWHHIKSLDGRIAAHLAIGALLAMATMAAGCSRQAPPQPAAAAPVPAVTLPAAPAPTPAAPPAPAVPQPVFWTPEEPKQLPSQVAASSDGPAPSGRGLLPPQPVVDDAKFAAAGVRKLESRRLTLYTDVPSDPDVDGLCQVFDLAFPQWCAYFGVKEEDSPDWRITCYLIKDKERFQALGVLNDSLPPFANGYSRGSETWVYEQSTPYYRRHLMLHEGTHSFMDSRLPVKSPTWHREGMAELLGTHRWQDGKLELPYFPSNREEVPDWGRIRLVQDDFAQGRAKFLGNVLSFSPEGNLATEEYGWCWAAAAWLNGHPRYRERFRQLANLPRREDFAARFLTVFQDDLRDLGEEWQAFVGSIEYGHDLERSAIDFAPGDELPAGGKKVRVAADRGWQSSRLHVEADVACQLRAGGRYVIAETSQPWPCEPGGVTIRYYQGRPLGQLLAVVRADDQDENSPTAFLSPQVVGAQAMLTPKRSGTLYFKINDSAAELAENKGELEVFVAPAKP